jgi:hypothetical protein
MYSFLLPLHSALRWIVILMMLLSLYIAYQGLMRRLSFTPAANKIRHWTATIVHIQFTLGMFLYLQSPIVKYVNTQQTFFRYIHIVLMLLATVLVTIGSAKAKRMETAPSKYRTMLIWFLMALIVILVAIPWPFSPLAVRPYFRPFNP